MVDGSGPITRFAGQFRFLSNFYPCVITLPGEHYSYPSVEHAYQASKTLDLKEREWIRTADSPGEAKRRGRRITLRPDFDTQKLEIMRGLILQKFADPVLRAELLATDDREIVEGNWWGDTFWGVSYRTQDGENHLGRILMETRTFFARLGEIPWRCEKHDMPIVRTIPDTTGRTWFVSYSCGCRFTRERGPKP